MLRDATTLSQQTTQLFEAAFEAAKTELGLPKTIQRRFFDRTAKTLVYDDGTPLDDAHLPPPEPEPVNEPVPEPAPMIDEADVKEREETTEQPPERAGAW